jgi:hypothetical protein
MYIILSICSLNRKPLDVKQGSESVTNSLSAVKPYGYAVNFSGFNELRFIAAIINKNIKSRYAVKPFTVDGAVFNSGSFIIARGDNGNMENKFDQIVTNEANRFGVKLSSVTSGLVENGKDFGSNYSPLMKKVKVAVLCGDGTSSGQVGELWYFFERELDYPVSLINTVNAENVKLND